MSGNIEFDAPLTKGGRYEFTSHSGNVRIVLSGNTGFELDADTFSGSVRSDLPVTLRADRASPIGTARGSQPGHPRLLRRRQRLPVGPQPFSGSVVICRRSSARLPTLCLLSHSQLGLAFMHEPCGTLLA